MYKQANIYSRRSMRSIIIRRWDSLSPWFCIFARFHLSTLHRIANR